jgi:hypothetical protein
LNLFELSVSTEQLGLSFTLALNAAYIVDGAEDFIPDRFACTGTCNNNRTFGGQGGRAVTFGRKHQSGAFTTGAAEQS